MQLSSNHSCLSRINRRSRRNQGDTRARLLGFSDGTYTSVRGFFVGAVVGSLRATGSWMHNSIDPGEKDFIFIIVKVNFHTCI